MPKVAAAFEVLKFGGTSLANYAAMERCASIVGNGSAPRVVVVSASAHVTDHLHILSKGVKGEGDRKDLIDNIKNIQDSILDCLPDTEALRTKIDAILGHIETLSLSLADGEDEAIRDALLSLGEKISSHIFQAVLIRNGVDAKLLDAESIIRTDSNFGNAEPEPSVIKTLVLRELGAPDTKSVWVVQGFVGADINGKTTTFGRGGSDYSAALIAEALEASELQIWTDVTGMYSTDPRIESKAERIPRISFNEAAEMATFGAKILHPKTLMPVVNANIPTFVGSSREPEAGGTHIMPDWEGDNDLKAVALRRNQTLLTLTSFNMLHSYGFLAKVFEILSKHKVSVDLVTTSEVSVALTFDKAGDDLKLSKDLLGDLEGLGDLKVDRNLALIALIGNNLDQNPGIAANLFSELIDINLRLICHGASPHNICFLVDEKVANDVVRRVHKIIMEA